MQHERYFRKPKILLGGFTVVRGGADAYRDDVGHLHQGLQLGCLADPAGLLEKAVMPDALIMHSYTKACTTGDISRATVLYFTAVHRDVRLRLTTYI